HFLPPQGNGLQGRTRVWQLASLISVLLVIILLLVIIFQAVRGTNSQNPNMSNTQSPAAVQPGAGNASTPATQATATVNPLPSPSGLALTVRAYIDGRSDLILHRNTV